MSGPQEYAARHARDPFEALPHGGSIFDAPPAGRAAAAGHARRLVAQFRAAGCTERFPDGIDEWCGQAAAVLEELTRDG